MHPDDEDPEPGHSTGPRTAAGKAASAMNRLTHGCRSEQVILRSEDPAQYTAVIQAWFQQYNPQTPAERLLVDETAHAQWFLLRTQRRFDEVDYEKNMYFRHWTEDQHREYALALRYKTTAERAFLRWFKELESYYARVQRKQRLDARPAPVGPSDAGTASPRQLPAKTPEISSQPQPTPPVCPGLLPISPRPRNSFSPPGPPPHP